MGKEIKDCFIKVRITKSEREQIDAYCEKHDLTISELVRLALEKYFSKE